MRRPDSPSTISRPARVSAETTSWPSRAGLSTRWATRSRRRGCAFSRAKRGRGRLATVGTLSAGVAHEINNPLAYTLANLGYVAERLRELPGTPDCAEVVTAVEEATEGAERVRRIVKDMKTLSRVDDETIGAVDVERALDASVNMALHELRHKATVMKDYAGVGFARANEGRLVQVFLNLLV